MIKTDPQTGIIYHSWQVPDSQVALLLVHGLGAHSGRWKPFAEFLSSQKISSYALELKGFGSTSGPKGHIESFDTYFQDILTLRKIIATENPGKKIFLCGESFGGLLSFSLALKDQKAFYGLILFSPAFSIKMQVSLWTYLQVIMHLFIDPKKQFPAQITNSMCTRDPEYQKQLDFDHLESRVVSAKFVLNYFLAETEARKSKAKWSMPILFLVAGEDYIVNPQETKRIYRWLDAQDKEIKKYPEMYHALSVELVKEQVFEYIIKWIKNRL
jgi:alpha-beta hydrolase superfamily lysophospholipase